MQGFYKYPILLILLLGSVVAGCASSSAVTPYGKDSYIVAVDDTWGVKAPSQLQVVAAQKANAFCAQQGKVLRVRSTTHGGVAWVSGTSSSLVFSCISEQDPENTRPDLRSGN